MCDWHKKWNGRHKQNWTLTTRKYMIYLRHKWLSFDLVFLSSKGYVIRIVSWSLDAEGSVVYKLISTEKDRMSRREVKKTNCRCPRTFSQEKMFLRWNHCDFRGISSWIWRQNQDRQTSHCLKLWLWNIEIFSKFLSAQTGRSSLLICSLPRLLR